jgi:hypothetical protein
LTVKRKSIAELIRCAALSTYEAEMGYWDYCGNPDGFGAVREDLEQALLLMGEPLPDYAARDAEEDEGDDEDDEDEPEGGEG